MNRRKPSELMIGNSVRVSKRTWRRLFLLKNKSEKHSVDDLMNLLFGG